MGNKFKIIYFLVFYFLEVLFFSLFFSFFSDRFIALFFSQFLVLVLIVIFEKSSPDSGLFLDFKRNFTLKMLFFSVLLGTGLFFLCRFFTLQIAAFFRVNVTSASNEAAFFFARKDYLYLSLVFLEIVVLTPVLEEILFRYYLFNGIAEIREKGALTFTTIVFAFVHSGIPLRMLFVLFIGFCFTFLYKKKKNLGYSVIMHAVVNFLGVWTEHLKGITGFF